MVLSCLLRRLESLNEARQGQVSRVKIAEKEREGLEGEKIAAEAYLFKDAERLGAQSKIFQRFMHDGKVSQRTQYCYGRIQASGSAYAPVLTSSHVQAYARCA